ncbi:MarR family transcriptional regulator [Streptomyces sp. NPDC093252]|uniref:MarR family transcriptional regulator n=1 Tax=Streptomyces sp. NPDC093252 TaxID=3154980 RepID=UPI00343E1BB7
MTTTHAPHSTPTTPTHAPALDPRVIALAHYASRGVLEAVLGRHGVSFQEQVTMRPVATAGGPVERADLIRVMTDALKVPASSIGETVDGLIGKGLLTADGSGPLRLTDAGQALYETTGAESRPITTRIYDGIPAEDLAVAGRVLTLIAERAGAELDGLRTQRA